MEVRDFLDSEIKPDLEVELKESLMLQKSMDFRSRDFRNLIICFE